MLELIYKKLLLLVIFSITLSILSCCDECEPNSCNPSSGILGNWQWSKSIGGLAGITITPETAGYTKRFILDAYLYKEYLNDTFNYESQYDLQIKPETFIGINEYLTLGTGTEWAIDFSDDTLRLYDLCPDCFLHVYIRK